MNMIEKRVNMCTLQGRYLKNGIGDNVTVPNIIKLKYFLMKTIK